jgi:transposase
MAPLCHQLPLLLEDEENQPSRCFPERLGEMAERLELRDRRIRDYDFTLESSFSHAERCQRLGRVEAVGPLAATALVAAVGNAHQFGNGRELSAGLGLVPRQYSTGGRSALEHQ